MKTLPITFLLACSLVVLLPACSSNRTTTAATPPAATSPTATPSTAPARHGTVTASRAIPFANPASVRPAVREECSLPTRFAGFIKSFGRQAGIKVRLTEQPLTNVAGRVLNVKITRIHGPGGGAWSGAKWVTVEGKLTEGGKVIGTFVAARYSGGGAFAMFKGTCDILGRCIETLGRDIAQWMLNPSMDARLGNA